MADEAQYFGGKQVVKRGRRTSDCLDGEVDLGHVAQQLGFTRYQGIELDNFLAIGFEKIGKPEQYRCTFGRGLRSPPWEGRPRSGNGSVYILFICHMYIICDKRAICWVVAGQA